MIVGAGAVGGFFGAHLAKHHPHVSFVLRPRTLHAVHHNGLTVRSANGTFTVRPAVAGDPRDLPKPDLIILATKAYDLDPALDQLAPVLTDRTVLLTLQNGVDVEERVLARVKRGHVVGGVAFIYSKIAEPGVIEHYKRGAITIGELTGETSPQAIQIAALFTQAGLSCRISEDIRRTKWEKMCWNCAFNPLTVVIDDRISKALDQPHMLRTIEKVVGEVVTIAAALNVSLPSDMAEKVLRWSQEIRDIHTSMYDDWKSGRATEIDSLNGYIVKRGYQLGIPTPLNEALTAIVKVMTESVRQRPDVLRIDGAVIQPITLDQTALAKLPSEHQVTDVGNLDPGMRGRGIRVKGLLEIPTPAIDVDSVVFHSYDGTFTARLTLREAADHGILVYQLDEHPLPPHQGGPYRLITPGLGNACANVKGVGRIELIHSQNPTPSHT
jgi:2-dehydropantoate 2-reductase